MSAPLRLPRPDRGVVLVVSGPSGVGKSTLIGHLRTRFPDLGFSVSATTRAPRPGELDGVDYRIDELFGFEVPVEVPDVDSSLLDPRSTWSDPAAYDEKARELAAMFTENFAKFDADENLVQAGPRA